MAVQGSRVLKDDYPGVIFRFGRFRAKAPSRCPEVWVPG